MAKHKAKTTGEKKNVQENKDKNKVRNTKVSGENVKKTITSEGKLCRKKVSGMYRHPHIHGRGDGLEEDMLACTPGGSATKSPTKN